MNAFVLRRQKLLDMMKENSVMLIYAGQPKMVSEDERFPFIANRNFFYLTGIEQENSVLMLIKSIGDSKEYLFVDEYSELKEKWTGRRIDFDVAREISGMENVQATSTLEAMIELALADKNNVYGKIENLYLDLSPELKVGECLSTRELGKKLIEKHPNISLLNLKDLLIEMRMVKDEEEIANIYEAIHVTNLGLSDLIINLSAGKKEFELSDRFEMYGRSHGRHPLAFSTITAGGVNAVILHHPIEQQDDHIRNSDLVLFDLGFKHNGYSADVSRTYPVCGVFSPIQRKIYEAVLECNKAVIEYAKAGLTIANLQEFATLNLRQSCIRLGLMDENDDIRKYYYHNVSHFLGLDTHDVGFRDRPLVPGNVITVEPGLYFKDLGIGVRIEDDILITNDKATVLTSSIKKEISDIEKMFKGRAK